jgi:hypothetical protein
MTPNERRDAAVFAAIANFKSVTRQYAAAERAFRKLCEAHPELADCRPRIEIEIDGTIMYAHCPAEIENHIAVARRNGSDISAGERLRKLKEYEDAWEAAVPGHRAARRAAGILRAQIAASDLYHKKRLALRRVQRAQGTTFRGVVAQARCIAAYMAAEITATAPQRAALKRSIKAGKACADHERLWREDDDAHDRAFEAAAGLVRRIAELGYPH